MNAMPIHKYRAYQPVDLPDRRWPSQVITKPPIWCSVDLRDGNQALVEPMGPDRKQRMFEHLVKLGFKEIEVGFPAASQTDFDFVRQLIEENQIPEDVTIQVLTQARPELIERTFEAICGARRAIVHLYNSTSTVQRRVVFGLERDGITRIAVDGARLIKKLTQSIPETEVVLEYSPESFTGTELDYAKEICEAVMDVWQPTAEHPMIFNLPATVEMATPNVYADQIEWFSRNVKNREAIILSVHPHNDRGCGVAAAELSIMAGCDRVEGTLFGNGERTGNVDVVTIALNMFSQGIDPGLDFSDIGEVVRTVEYCNQLPVHPRHPYGGELVFTAFSGSHQDAIKKGMAAMSGSNSGIWEVPYLPIDPQDLGRDYEAVIRVNSQSGKGGIAYLLQQDHDFDLPRRLQIEFAQVIQRITDETGKEIGSRQIVDAFSSTYMAGGRIAYASHRDQAIARSEGGGRKVDAVVTVAGRPHPIEGQGSDAVEGFVAGMRSLFGTEVDLLDSRSHPRSARGGHAAYVELAVNGRSWFGAAVSDEPEVAQIEAAIAAMNRAMA